MGDLPESACDRSARNSTIYNVSKEVNTLFEGKIDGLTLNAFGWEIPMEEILSNGRSNYILFQKLAAMAAGLEGNSEGGDSDLVDANGLKYEVKAFRDIEAHPDTKHDLFHTAASSTFSANNHGPEINALLSEGRYAEAKEVCIQTGYGKNDFYVYTNTAQYSTKTPFRFIIVPTSEVLEMLDTNDPRLIDRQKVLARSVTKKQIILTNPS